MKIQYFTRYGVVEFFFHLLRNLRSHYGETFILLKVNSKITKKFS